MQVRLNGEPETEWALVWSPLASTRFFAGISGQAALILCSPVQSQMSPPLVTFHRETLGHSVDDGGGVLLLLPKLMCVCLPEKALAYS